VFEDVATHSERLDQPLRWQRPRRIFVNSMSDLFHAAVPFDFIDQVFAVMALCPQHTFQILTKRPDRMVEYVLKRYDFLREATLFSHLICHKGSNLHPRLKEAGWLWDTYIDEDGSKDSELEYWGKLPLPNVQLGISVESQPYWDERAPYLAQLTAQGWFTWVSFEPLLGPVDFINSLHTPVVKWAVAGGESGPDARPSHPDWFRSLRDQCRSAGVPFNFKQWGEWLHESQSEENLWGKFVELRQVEGNVGKHYQYGGYTYRVGKKAAGRKLDGQLHDEYPEAQ
jgi:protein gp37